MAKRMFEDRVDKLEDVPEADRDFYEEAPDGNGFVLANPKGLKSSNRALKAEKIALQEKVTKIEADIVKYTAIGDYETVRRLKDKQAEIEQATITTSAELETFKREFTASKDSETKAEREKRERLERQYESEKIDTALTAALASANTTPEGMEYLAKVLKTDLKVFWENGVPVVKVVDAKGEPKRNAELDLMTIPELVAGHKQKVPHFFRAGKGSGGGGGAGDDDISVGEFDKKPSTWSTAIMKKYIQAHGHDSYRKLVAAETEAARKAG